MGLKISAMKKEVQSTQLSATPWIGLGKNNPLGELKMKPTDKIDHFVWGKLRLRILDKSVGGVDSRIGHYVYGPLINQIFNLSWDQTLRTGWDTPSQFSCAYRLFEEINR